jgi:Zn-dependent protease with chaperone function
MTANNLQPQAIEGWAFPPLSSRKTPAKLAIDGSSVRLIDTEGEQLTEAARRKLRISAPMGQAPRQIKFPDGTLFETPNAPGVDGLAENPLGSLLHKMERFGPRLLLIGLACIVGVVLIWRFALPVLVSVAVFLTPDPFLRSIDRGTLQTFDLTIGEPTTLSTTQQEDVRNTLDRLLAALPEGTRSRSEFNLLFRATPGMGPNAFALPGGTMVVTDALVRDFDDPDVIASVLGHEIGHVADAHGLKRLYRSLGTYVLIALIAGDTGPIVEDLLLEGNLLLSLSHSRGQEREADDYGIDLARKAGFDPSGLLVFFEKLPDAGESWLSTHPSNAERLDRIRRRIGD